MIGNKTFGNYAICKIDDTGCHAKPDKKVESSNVLKGRIKIHRSSIMIMDTHKGHVTKGFIFECLFSHAKSIGNRRASTFCPADIMHRPRW